MGPLADLLLGALLEPEDAKKVRAFLERDRPGARAKAKQGDKSKPIETEGEGEDIP